MGIAHLNRLFCSLNVHIQEFHGLLPGRGQLALNRVAGCCGHEILRGLKGEHNSSFSTPGQGIKNLTLFLEVDICLFSTLPVSSTATAQRVKLPLTSASRALTSEATPTSLACINSTPSWKSEPSFGMLLKNMAETRSYASRVIGLKRLRFHLVKHRKPL